MFPLLTTVETLNHIFSTFVFHSALLWFKLRLKRIAHIKATMAQAFFQKPHGYFSLVDYIDI